METKDINFSREALRYAGSKWNEARLDAFREATQSILAYYEGCGDHVRLDEVDDIIHGLKLIAARGIYDLDTGEIADKTLPYRKNWYD